VSEGNLVKYRPDGKTFFVVTKKKKCYYPLKDRVEVVNPVRGDKHWFLEEDLEVLNGNDYEDR
tara:strand:- start:314 stop:502 length:189 start_codon:yes stop_codon:yes gene_type:complete